LDLKNSNASKTPTKSTLIDSSSAVSSFLSPLSPLSNTSLHNQTKIPTQQELLLSESGSESEDDEFESSSSFSSQKLNSLKRKRESMSTPISDSSLSENINIDNASINLDTSSSLNIQSSTSKSGIKKQKIDQDLSIDTTFMGEIKVGNFLEAKDPKTGFWYKVKIIKIINKKENIVRIHWNNWNSSLDENLSINKNNLRQITNNENIIEGTISKFGPVLVKE